jgi:phosphoribosylanthranilate isomerase
VSQATAVKFCGLTRREDALRADSLGARYGGVILAPGGKRSVTPDAAGALLAGTTLSRVGVFVDAPAETIARDAAVVGLDVLQLHGSETPETIDALREAGEWTIWKAIRPRSASDFLEALDRYGTVADALLLDGWSPAAAGGTGTSFPWDEVAGVLAFLPPSIGLVVAGGLDPSNVGRAISLLRPAVVDVSSGVESAPGAKDPAAMAAFIEAVRHPALHSSSIPDA